MDTRLTHRQWQIKGFLERFIRDNGYPPTRAEICREFKFRSPNAAEEHLRALQNKCHIRMIPGIARGIQIV